MVVSHGDSRESMNQVNRKQMDDAHCEALKQLKMRLNDVLKPQHTDAILLKWLRAKNFSVKKSELIFRQFLRMRDVFLLDTLVERYVKPEVVKYEFHGFLGFAKDGTPVRYIALGKGDYLSFMKSMSTSEITRYCTSIMETDIRAMKEQSAKLGKEINEGTYIFDMEGFVLQSAWHKPILELAWDLSRSVQDTYPEIWRIVIFINVPPIFQMAFNFFKPIFRMNLMNKIRVVKKENTAEELLTHIDAEVLPAFLGGKRKDCNGNPLCTEFINFGGMIPEEYHYSHDSYLLENEPSVQTVSIAPRTSYNYSLVVPEAGCRLNFELRSETSIDVTMFYKEFGLHGEMADVPSADEYISENDTESDFKLVSIPMRLQTHLVPMNERMTILPWPGIYIIRFDNTYSWFSSKRVFFRIHTLPSDKEITEL